MKVLLLACLLLPFTCLSQNLVPNPSFEEYDMCPSTLSAIYACSSWRNFGETPDYFNGCSPNIGFTNPVGTQNPYHGNAYAGFIAFIDPPGDAREFIGVQLTEPLQQGETYYVSMYVVKAEGGTINQMMNACNNVGARFSTIPYDSLSITDLNNWSHIKVDSIVTGIDNWVGVNGSIVADSAYEYLVLGNFYDDANTTIAHPPNSQEYRQAYYYVDQVCVSNSPSDCGLVSINAISSEPTISIYPNPFVSGISFSCHTPVNAFKLFDSHGRIVSTHKLDFSIKKGYIQLDFLEAGAYILELQSETFFRQTIIKSNL
jgi:hypothetical protein